MRAKISPDLCMQTEQKLFSRVL